MEPEGSLPCLQETATGSCGVLSYLHLGLTIVCFLSCQKQSCTSVQKVGYIRTVGFRCVGLFPNMNYESNLLCKRMNNYVSLVDLFTRSIFKVLDLSALKRTMYWFSHLLHKYRINMSRDNSVGIATGYGLDDRGVGVRVPVGSRIFSSPRRSDLLWGPPNLLSCPMDAVGPAPGVRRPEHEPDHSSPPTTEVKNDGTISRLPPYVLMAQCLNT
jgi:hypothetical protein